MHGLINRALQNFITDSFGAPAWRAISQRAGILQLLGPDGFEAMQIYEDRLTEALLESAGAILRRPQESLLEDLGTYLVSNEKMDRLRRLLRFGGVSFTDFLYSLDDLQGRSHMAVPDLALPAFELGITGRHHYTLTCRGGAPGAGHVMVGILRAIADDYGALVVLEHHGAEGGGIETIGIEVHDPAHHEGNRFELAAGVQ